MSQPIVTLRAGQFAGQAFFQPVIYVPAVEG